MNTSSRGLALIQQFEGERLQAYQDSVGVWTVGVGHTGPEVHRGLTITSQDSILLLATDVRKVDQAITAFVHVPLTQNQWDALASFAFNLGIAALRGCTLLKLLNARDYMGAQAQFAKWNHAGGHELEGLTARRDAEAVLFGTPA